MLKQKASVVILNGRRMYNLALLRHPELDDIDDLLNDQHDDDVADHDASSPDSKFNKQVYLAKFVMSLFKPFRKPQDICHAPEQNDHWVQSARQFLNTEDTDESRLASYVCNNIQEYYYGKQDAHLQQLHEHALTTAASDDHDSDIDLDAESVDELREQDLPDSPLEDLPLDLDDIAHKHPYQSPQIYTNLSLVNDQIAADWKHTLEHASAHPPEPTAGFSDSQSDAHSADTNVVTKPQAAFITLHELYSKHTNTVPLTETASPMQHFPNTSLPYPTIDDIIQSFQLTSEQSAAFQLFAMILLSLLINEHIQTNNGTQLINCYNLHVHV
eukprot:gb/GECG01005898.1/.p1 GENE.gb/GECG01005898.1/~~gb/GECG01005898.1/.p1  ORF type:complete len:329 (+),score=27.79 gb/GECG01005898.1/:1-987(+)